MASCRQSWTVWRTIGWSGISTGPAAALSWHATSAGNAAAIRSSASMRWMGGGVRRPPRWRSTRSARPTFQRQRTWNIGATSAAWTSASGAARGDSMRGSSSSGQALLGAERQQDRVVGGRRLELEVEPPAEPLAQVEAEGAVEPGAEGRVDHELGAAALVEEALEHQILLRRQHAERRLRGGQVAHDLAGRVVAEAGLGGEPGDRGPAAARAVDLLPDAPAQRRHRRRQLRGATGRLAEPERHRRRGAAGVHHAHDARFHAADPPRGAAQEEHVAGHALDGPVLVDGADHGVVGIGEHAVVRRLRDGSARGQGGDARAAPGAEAPVDAGRGADTRRAGRGRSAMPSASMATTASKSSRLRWA